MREKVEALRDFERMLDISKLKALSRASLERELTPGEHREFLNLAESVGIKKEV